MYKHASKDHNRYNSNKMASYPFEEQFGASKQCIVPHSIWVFIVCQGSHFGVTEVSLGIPCIPAQTHLL